MDFLKKIVLELLKPIFSILGEVVKKIFDHFMSTPLDDIKAVKARAEKGEPEAQYYLGLAYYEGEQVSKNYSEACRWWLKAANQEHLEAQYQLGNIYRRGKEDVIRNCAKAVEWFLKAANGGHHRAQCSLGFMYLNGEGIDKDRPEAVKWFRKAARQDNKLAQKKLNDLGETW